MHASQPPPKVRMARVFSSTSALIPPPENVLAGGGLCKTTRTRWRVPILLSLLLLPLLTSSASCKAAQKNAAANTLGHFSEFVYDLGKAVAPVSIPIGTVLTSLGLAGVGISRAIVLSERNARVQKAFGWDGKERRSKQRLAADAANGLTRRPRADWTSTNRSEASEATTQDAPPKPTA